MNKPIAFTCASLIVALGLFACSHQPTQSTENVSRGLASTEPREEEPEKRVWKDSFSDVDQNHDGKVKLAEFDDRITLLFGEHDANRDGFLERKELKSLPSWYHDADRRKVDGRVSIIEFMAEADRAFAAADDNKDRKLTATEAGKLSLKP